MAVPPFQILLLSFYELGRQPFGMASPAAWLRQDGFDLTCVDCDVDKLTDEQIQEADLIAFYVPMHTATRLALEMWNRVKKMNPAAHTCFFGLYAPLNRVYLQKMGVDTILGGEFETDLLGLSRRLREAKAQNIAPQPQVEPFVSLQRQQFLTPDRHGLPSLENYAQLFFQNQPGKLTGYVETTRGCKHLCRHCPIVPVYNGRFRVINRETVLADIRQQVAMGAQHITFGDPDFFNGPGHVLPIIRQMHEEFPTLTYDVTIKIEHLLKYEKYLPALRDSGCLFITSAVESVDNQALKIFDKGHTREDFIKAVHLLNQIGIHLNPTFVTFHPWITLEGYRGMLSLIAELSLIENISPIQWAIRLLIPAGSRLLELPETHTVLGNFNEQRLSYEWSHPDKRMDDLYQQVKKMVSLKKNRQAIFKEIWALVETVSGKKISMPAVETGLPRAAVPYLNEPWYC